MTNIYTRTSSYFHCGSGTKKLVGWLRLINAHTGNDFDTENMLAEDVHLPSLPEGFPIGVKGIDLHNGDVFLFDECEAGLTIWTEEETNTEQLAVLITELMNQTPDMASPQGFQFAQYADKPKTDHFGGGFVICQRGKEPMFFDTFGMMMDKIDEASGRPVLETFASSS